MPRDNEDINRIQAPVDLATKMFMDQQDRLLNTIVGPPKRTRREMVGGIPIEEILPVVLENMEQL